MVVDIDVGCLTSWVGPTKILAAGTITQKVTALLSTLVLVAVSSRRNEAPCRAVDSPPAVVYTIGSAGHLLLLFQPSLVLSGSVKVNAGKFVARYSPLPLHLCRCVWCVLALLPFLFHHDGECCARMCPSPPPPPPVRGKWRPHEAIHRRDTILRNKSHAKPGKNAKEHPNVGGDLHRVPHLSGDGCVTNRQM